MIPRGLPAFLMHSVGREGLGQIKPIFWSLCVGIIVHIGCILILASVPPISRDALVHHLAIPKMYLARGEIYEIPSMRFSYFPMNVDLLYLLPLYFKNDIAAKYIHFIFALLTAGLIYRYLKDTLDKTYGLIGALFFLTIPIIVKLSVTVYVDLGLIFFSWAGLYFFIKWFDSNFKPKQLGYAGLCCGLALGTKYNGLILLPIMGMLVPVTYSLTANKGLPRNEVRRRYKNSFKGLQWGVVFILLSLIVFSPWMIRNTLWKQNPVYPLFKNVFDPQKTVDSLENQETRRTATNTAFWTRRHIYKESFAETLLIPIRAFFQGQDNNPKYFDGKLNPFLLLLPLFAFLPGKEKRTKSLSSHKAVLLVFAVLFTLFVFFRSDYRIRYMAPAIPPLVVLSVFGIQNIVKMISQQTAITKKTGRTVFTLTLFFMFFLNGSYSYSQFNYIRPFDILLKKVDRDTYVSRYRREHPVVLHANRTLPKDARILCLATGKRTYYIERSVHLAGDFFKRRDGKFSESSLLKKLERYGTTHIILDKKYILNWLRTLNKEDQTVFLHVFQNSTELLYSKNDVLLLKFIKK